MKFHSWAFRVVFVGLLSLQVLACHGGPSDSRSSGLGSSGWNLDSTANSSKNLCSSDVIEKYEKIAVVDRIYKTDTPFSAKAYDLQAYRDYVDHFERLQKEVEDFRDQPECFRYDFSAKSLQKDWLVKLARKISKKEIQKHTPKLRFSTLLHKLKKETGIQFRESAKESVNGRLDVVQWRIYDRAGVNPNLAKVSRAIKKFLKDSDRLKTEFSELKEDIEFKTYSIFAGYLGAHINLAIVSGYPADRDFKESYQAFLSWAPRDAGDQKLLPTR